MNLKLHRNFDRGGITIRIRAIHSVLRIWMFFSLLIPTVAMLTFAYILISNLSYVSNTSWVYYSLICLCSVLNILFTTFLFFGIRKNLNNSLHIVHDWSNKIKSGDLTTRLSFSPKNDLYFIAESFNKMADILQDLLSENTRKVELLNEQKQALESTNSDLVMALVSAIEARDKYTLGHSERVSKYAVQLATQLNLPEEKIEEVKVAGMLHDVGKIGISDNILNKPTKLSRDEFEEIKRHPSIGSWILNNINLSASTINAINYHHERYDGKGYPFGLSGKELSLEAQIISLSDAYDAMTSARPYRHAMSHIEAIDEIKRCSKTQFSPELVSLIEKSNFADVSSMM